MLPELKVGPAGRFTRRVGLVLQPETMKENWLSSMQTGCKGFHRLPFACWEAEAYLPSCSPSGASKEGDDSTRAPAAQTECFVPKCGEHGTFRPPCACTCDPGYVTGAPQPPSESYVWCGMPVTAASVTIALAASVPPRTLPYPGRMTPRCLPGLLDGQRLCRA